MSDSFSIISRSSSNSMLILSSKYSFLKSFTYSFFLGHFYSFYDFSENIFYC